MLVRHLILPTGEILASTGILLENRVEKMGDVYWRDIDDENERDYWREIALKVEIELT